jgi:hypothetical protein
LLRPVAPIGPCSPVHLIPRTTRFQVDSWESLEEKIGRRDTEGSDSSDSAVSEAATRNGRIDGSQSPPAVSTPFGAESHDGEEAPKEPEGKDSSAAAPARVFPRRKRGEAVRATDKPVLLTSEMLSPHFDKPLKEAAKALVRSRPDDGCVWAA